jgi:hypothetical protein
MIVERNFDKNEILIGWWMRIGKIKLSLFPVLE